MKKIIYTLILILCSSIAFTQDSIPKEIVSIGKFEIKSTTISIISELEKELGIKVKVCASIDDYFKYQDSKGKYILQLVKDNTNKYSPTQASNCEKVKVYSVGGYSIANIELKNLELTFLNDTLVGFKCDRTSEFIEAIHLKYGRGKLQKTEKEVTCEVGRLGTKVELQETTIYESWGENDIRATAVISVYYNNKCEKKYLSYFSLSSTAAIKEKRTCEDSNKQEEKRREEEEKRKSLDGF